jgi:hypothetical protein
MRTVLAAAAAGALVLGSAGGAMAHPHTSDKARGSTASEPVSRLLNVNIKRHEKIDLADVTDTTALRLRAKVHNSKKVKAEDALESVHVTLAVYDRKFSVDAVKDSESTEAELTLKVKRKAQRNQFYAGSAVISQVWGEDQVAALAAAVAEDGKAYICISGVTEDFDRYSKQTRKRLDMGVKRPVRDCVKVVNSAVVTP